MPGEQETMLMKDTSYIPRAVICQDIKMSIWPEEYEILYKSHFMGYTFNIILFCFFNLVKSIWKSEACIFQRQGFLQGFHNLEMSADGKA